jgi:hypothetical protein
VLLLSGILMATTVFPNLHVVTITEYLAVAIVILVPIAGGVLNWLQRRNPMVAVATGAPDGRDKMQWRMPPLALLQPVTWSPGTKLGMLALRGYLVVGAVLLVVKAVQLGGR